MPSIALAPPVATHTAPIEAMPIQHYLQFKDLSADTYGYL